jgi:hypothetical protein
VAVCSLEAYVKIRRILTVFFSPLSVQFGLVHDMPIISIAFQLRYGWIRTALQLQKRRSRLNVPLGSYSLSVNPIRSQSWLTSSDPFLPVYAVGRGSLRDKCAL